MLGKVSFLVMYFSLVDFYDFIASNPDLGIFGKLCKDKNMTL